MIGPPNIPNDINYHIDDPGTDANLEALILTTPRWVCNLDQSPGIQNESLA